MTMMQKFKVTPETPITIKVLVAREVVGQYGPQIQFEGDDGNGECVIYEKKENVERQLARVGLSLASVIGQTVRLWKENVQNANGQTFAALRIDVAGGVAAAPRVAPAPNGRAAISMGGPLPYESAPVFPGDPGPSAMPPANAAPTAPAVDRFASLAALHARCFATALLYADKFGVAHVEGDVAGAVSALTAQLFIASTQKGLA